MDAKTPASLDAVEVYPILPSLSFSQTSEFYVDRLGFEEVASPTEDYRIFRRGRMMLWFWYCQDPMIALNSSVFVKADRASELYQEFTERGIEGVRAMDEDEMPCQKFHVRDPHGNVLIFVNPAAMERANEMAKAAATA